MMVDSSENDVSLPVEGGSPTQPVTAADLARSLHRARVQAFLRPNHTEVTTVLGSELERLVARTAEVYASAITDDTRATYARRWALFVAWCRSHDLDYLPALPETVMLYLGDAVGSRSVALSTMRGWAAAIARVHMEAGFPSPTEDPAMTLFLRGLSRMAPEREREEPITALRIAPLRAVCRSIDLNAVDAKEVRDRALIALLAAGAHEAAVARVRWADVAFRPKSVVVTLYPVQRASTPPAPVVLRLWERATPATCPVLALRAWRALSLDVSPDAAVFTVIRSSQVTGKAMQTADVRRVSTVRLSALCPVGATTTPEEAMRVLGNHRSVDLRDKAILLAGFAGAFRRNEVTNLRWSDITVRDGSGIVIHLRRSKTDQAGRGKDVGIPLGRSLLTCPVRALTAWRERVELQNGPVDPEGSVFVHVGRSGRITERPLTPEGLTVLVRHRAEEAGLQGRWGGRSLRAGFISTAADLEIPLERVAAQSRHLTLDSLARYIRRLDPFAGSAAAKVGL